VVPPTSTVSAVRVALIVVCSLLRLVCLAILTIAGQETETILIRLVFGFVLVLLRRARFILAVCVRVCAD
jgi:hypothetical protein